MERPLPPPSFEEFCRTHRGRLLAQVARRTGSREDAEDICQEALARAWRSWDEVRLQAPEAWVATVAGRLVIDGWRRRSYATRRLPLLAGLEAGEDDASTEAVREAVAALPPRVRSVVVLYYFEDWAVARIAASTGVTPAAVKSRLHRGRAALAAELRPAERPAARAA